MGDRARRPQAEALRRLDRLDADHPGVRRSHGLHAALLLHARPAVRGEGGAQIESVDDLARKTVGVGLATTFYDFLKQNTGAVAKGYATTTDAFPDLLNGTLDFVLTAGPTGQQAILEGQPVESSGKPLFYEKLGIAVADGESDWVKLLDYAVAEMHRDGSLSDLSRKWYNDLDLTVGY